MTKEIAEAAVAAIDWDRIDAMTDADIERQIAGSPDAAPDLQAYDARAVWHSGQPLPHRIAAARKALGLSRPEFATAYGISVRTLAGWEQGSRAPDVAGTSYLSVIFAMPHQVAEAVAAGVQKQAS